MCALEITATYIPSLIPVKAYQRRVLVYEQYPKNFRIRISICVRLCTTDSVIPIAMIVTIIAAATATAAAADDSNGDNDDDDVDDE